MKQKNYQRWSRWLFLTLLTLLVGVSPAWAQAKELPYSYGFEDNNLATDGWTKQNPGNNNSSKFIISTSAKQNGTYGFQFSSYDGGTANQLLVSPELNAPSGVVVSFAYKNSNAGSYYAETFKVGYSTTDTDPASFTWGDPINESSGTWKIYEETYPSGTKYIAVNYTSNNKYYLYVDDFSFSAPPTCIKPKGLTSTDISSSSVDLSWTSEADNFQIQYKKTSDGDWTLVNDIINATTYTLSVLEPATAYQVRVRTYCSAQDQSDWSDVYSFTTDCATITIDANHSFSEDFSAGNTLPNCWAVNNENKGSSGSGWTISSNMGYSGYYGDTYLILPAMQLSVASQLIFDNYFNYVSDYNGTTAKSSIVISTTGTAAGDFSTTLYTFEKSELPSSSSTALPKEISLAAYTGQTVYIAFKYEGNNAHAWYVDNVVVEQAPACPKPTALTASNPTSQGATLSWTAGSDETEWKIIYGAADFDPASEGTTIDNVTENPYTLTGLTPETTYDVYVKAVKGNDESAVSEKAAFTTLSAVPVIGLSATSHNFGMVSDADAQTLTLTISNTGGAALTGLTVTPTSGFAVTDMEGSALTATTIAASSTLSVKVKMSALGQQNGTITIDGNEIDEQVVNVSGYMLDDSKIAETFTSAAPDHWTEYAYKSGYSTYNWSYTADGAYNSNENSTLSTPKIEVAESEPLVVYGKLKNNATYGYILVEGSSDNGGTWAAYSKKLDYEAFSNTTNVFQLITLSDVPTTVNKLRFKCYYAYLNAINGFSYVADPVLSLYSDEDCTVAQDATATKNFGFVTVAQQQKYYIKNTGTGQIDLTIEQADGFTAAVDDAALTENEKATLTINMAATEGLHNGTLTVTAKNHDTVLGTFEVALNGAVAGSKNDVNFASLSDVPAGWDKGSWTVTANSDVQNNSGTAHEMTTATFTVGAGETMLVEAQGTNSYNPSTLTYSYKAGEADWTEAASIGTVTYNNWKVYAITGIPTGDAKVKFSGTYVRIRRIYGFTAKVEPFMVFAEDGTTKNFSMITAKATSDAYTITNSGTALLDNLSVTCDNANFEIAVADNANSIAAGSNVTFTVALKTTALGSQSGTVTIAGDGVESKTLNVKGYVADGSKIFTTFTALPDRWTNASNYWTFSANGASATCSSSKLETPKIIVAEGQKLAISAKQRYSGSSYYVTINGSSDNGETWTAYTKTLNNAQLNNTDYTIVELDDVPTTVNKLQLVGYYVYVNGLNGFTYDENDPEFSLFSDEECNTPIATTTVTNAWGFVNEDKTATYYIKNTGTGTMDLTKTDAPTGFTAMLGATSLGTGEKTSLTIAMANNSTTNEGYHAGDVVLTAKDNADNTLGTFTVTSSGVVVGASKTDVNFTALDAFPAGWEATGWSVTANEKVSVGYSSSTMTTGTYTVAAGESMVIKAKKQYNSGTLTYSYSTDNGETWSEAQTITPSSTSYELIAISGIPAGTAKIKFTGTYIDIQRIYGYTAVLEPAMTLSPAAASYDFGMQTAAAEYVITVTNSGTADMTNLAAALTGDDAEDFEVAVSKTTVPYTGENTATVTVTLKASTQYKEHNATLTISADGLADKVIALKGKTRDASKNYIDFASGIPAELTNIGWSTLNGYVYAGNAEATLTTKTLTIDANEKVYADAKLWQNTGYLKVRYSLNGGISWSDYTTYDSNNLTTSEWTRVEVDMQNASEAVAIVEFKGYYMYLDNIYGGVLNDEAPMISVTKSTAVVENGATEAFGSIMSEATATYTITNVGNGTLTITSPVTTTGVATATVNATSLTNGQSATLTITMPVEAPYGEKSGAVTVNTSLGNFVINYTATTMNPNALDEQFASDKPAGWYFGEYWKVSGEQAMQEDSGTPKDLITEQLTVAETSDVLTFQAARTSSYSVPTFHVYTSQDRVTWDAVDLGELMLTTSYQDVNISGLAAGDYYVKITGARVKVDNFLGWTKKNNTRDLYITATTFPATTTKGNEATITATVTSLIAEETGVYAKLFIDGTEKETAASQNIALNGTKTFSFNYAIPENKTAQIKVYYSDNAEAIVTAENAMKVNYTMSETDAPASFDAGTYNVSLTYTKGASKLGTICLPFATTTEELSTKYGVTVKIYELTSHADNVISFSGVENLDAGKPYLIYSDEELSGELTFADKAVVATASTTEASGVTFHGIYAPTSAGNWGAEWYGVTSEGKIAKGTNTTTMNGLRAYFTGNVANARIFIVDDENTTGIAAINRENMTIDNAAVYNLSGQKVQHAKKGLYIVNGKKVVIK